MRQYGNFTVEKQVRNEMECYVVSTVSGNYEVVYPITNEVYTLLDTLTSDNRYDNYMNTFLTVQYWVNNSLMDVEALNGMVDVILKWSEKLG